MTYDSTDSDADGVVESDIDNDKIDTNEVNTQSVDTNKQHKYTGSKPWVVYVRNDGDDSNSGLSESDPLRTISAALEAVMSIGVYNNDSFTHTIDLGNGETYSISDTISHPWVSRLEIVTNDRTGPKAHLEAPAGGDGFVVRESRVTFRNIVFEEADVNNPPDRYIKATRSEVEFEDGVEMYGAAVRHVHALYSSRVNGNDALIDGKGSGGDGFVIHSSSHLGLNSGATVRDCNNGIFLDRAGVMNDDGADIESCTAAILTQDNAAGKKVGGSIDNCSTAFKIQSGSQIKQKGNVSITNTPQTVDLVDGWYIDGDQNFTRQEDSGTSSARLKLTSDQSIPDSSGSEVEYDQKDHDSPVLSAEPANNQVVIQAPGDYEVTIAQQWDGQAGFSLGDFCQTYLKINGSLVARRRYAHTGSEAPASMPDLTYTVEGASEGDAITAELWQNSGSDKIASGNPDVSYIEVKRL